MSLCLIYAHLSAILVDAGKLSRSFEVPCSGSPQIVNISISSNVGRPGVWIFHIDGEEIIPACIDGSKEEVYPLMVFRVLTACPSIVLIFMHVM